MTNFFFENIFNAVEIDSKLYFAPANYPYLFTVDRANDWKVACVCELPWKSRPNGVQCILINNCIYCVSLSGLQICCYDLKSSLITYYDIEEESNRRNLCAEYKDREIYIYSHNLEDALVHFSIEKEQFYFDASIYETLNVDLQYKEVFFHSVSNGILYMLIRYTNQIITMNLLSKDVGILEVPTEELLFYIEVKEDEILFTTENECKLVIWNRTTGMCNCYKDVKNTEERFISVHKVNKHIILTDSENLKIFDGHDFLSFTIDNYYNLRKTGSFFVSILKNDEDAILMPWNANAICELKNDSIKTHDIKCPQSVSFRRHILTENDITLTEFIAVMKEQTDIPHVYRTKENVGSKIHKMIIEDKL